MSGSPILDELVRDLHAAGVVGVATQAMVIFLCNISRLLSKPQSYLVTGPSAAGKSFIVQSLIDLIPPDDVERFDSASDTALFYSNEPLTNKVVYVPETATLSDDVQAYLRVLVSEGSLSRDYTILKGAERETRHVERRGPCLVAQTTVDSVNHENETRALIIEIPDNPDQTRRVLEAIAARQSGRSTSMPVAHWRERDVTIPRVGTTVDPALAMGVAQLAYVKAVRMRRDFTAVLVLMQAHALLYADDRERDAQGRIVADMRDYAMVRDLLSVVLAVQVNASISLEVREFVTAVERLVSLRAPNPDEGPTTVTAKAAGATIGLDSRTAWRRARASLKGEYLVNDETRPRQPGKLRLGDPLPADIDALPSVADLTDYLESKPDLIAVDSQPIGDATDSADADGARRSDPASVAADPTLRLSTMSTPISSTVHDDVHDVAIERGSSFDEIYETLIREAGEQP